MKKLPLILFLTLLIFSACEKTKDPGATAAVKVANEWWVTLDSTGIPGSDPFGLGHFKIATYNTSANDNKIWIDDYKNGWQVKFKSTIDYKTLTFSADSAQNEYYDIKVQQTDGKILLNAGHSKSGNIVDSIHMKIAFGDVPGEVFEMNGVARTRFAEDDY